MARHKNNSLYLTIVESIKNEKYPAQIAKDLKKSKQNISYYTTELEKIGAIHEISKGVWTAEEDAVKRIENQLGQTQPPLNKLKINSFYLEHNKMNRGHSFRFRILLRKGIQNWERRAEYLTKKGVPYKLNQNVNPSFIFRGIRLWLCNRSIVAIYPKKKSFYCKDSAKSYAAAQNDFIGFEEHLERFLNLDLKINGKLHFTTTKNEYGSVMDALAKNYIKKDLKLQTRDENGVLRIIIDKSRTDGIPNLMEREAVSNVFPKGKNPQAVDDSIRMDGLVLATLEEPNPRRLFKDIDGLKELAGKQIEAIDKVTKNQQVFDKNMASHLEVLDKLGKAVEQLSEAVNRKKQHKEPDFWKAVFKNKYRARI